MWKEDVFFFMEYSQTQTIDMLKPGKEPRLLICNQGFSKKNALNARLYQV